MAYGFNRFITTAVLGGTMAFAGISSGWAGNDYTCEKGCTGWNLGSFLSTQPSVGQYGQYLQAANGIAGMAQGGLGQGLVGGLMSGNLDQIMKGVEQIGMGMLTQKINDLTGGALGGVGGSLISSALLGGSANSFGAFGTSGLGSNSLGGGISGLLGGGTSFGGAVPGIGDTLIGPANLSTSLGGLLESVGQQVAAGGIQGALSQAQSLLSGGGNSGGGGGGSSNSSIQPISTNNNFGGTTVYLDASDDAVPDTSSPNYDAGINAWLSGKGLSSAYLVTKSDGTTGYDASYKAGYDKAKADLAANSV